jgi:hypothetical protein
MAQSAPKVATNRGADASKSFAVSQSAVDLSAQVGKPPFAAQRLMLTNITASAVIVGITLVDDEGTTLSPQVAANASLPIDMPIKTLTTPAGIATIAYWWERGEPAAATSGRVARNP